MGPRLDVEAGPRRGAAVGLPDSASPSDTVEEDEDLYDCVENEEAEGDEIYEDLMRTEPVAMPVRAVAGRGARGSQEAGPRKPAGAPRTAQDDGA